MHRPLRHRTAVPICLKESLRRIRRPPHLPRAFQSKKFVRVLIQCRTATTTITVTVTSPAVAKRDFKPATTIYAGSPVTVVGPDTTSVVLNRRMVEARATAAPAPACLAQYSPPATRLTSACNCLSITSSTLTTVSTAPTTTTVSLASPFLANSQLYYPSCLAFGHLLASEPCEADTSPDVHNHSDIHCRSLTTLPKLQCLLFRCRL